MLLKGFKAAFLVFLWRALGSLNFRYQFRNFEDKRIDVSDQYSESARFAFRKNSIPLKRENEFIGVKKNFWLGSSSMPTAIIKQRISETDFFYWRLLLKRLEGGTFELSLYIFSKVDMRLFLKKDSSLGFLNCVNAFILDQTVTAVCANIAPAATDQRIRFENIIFFRCNMNLICEQFQFDFISFAHFNYNYNLQDNSNRFLRFLSQMELVATGKNSVVAIGFGEAESLAEQRESTTIELLFDQRSNFLRVNSRYLSKTLEYQLREIKEVYPDVVLLILETAFCVALKEKLVKFLSASKTDSGIVCDTYKYVSHFYDMQERTVSVIAFEKDSVFKQVYRIGEDITLTNTMRIDSTFSETQSLLGYFDLPKSRITISARSTNYKLLIQNNEFSLQFCFSYKFKNKPPGEECLIKQDLKVIVKDVFFLPDELQVHMLKADNSELFAIFVSQMQIDVQYWEPLFEIVIAADLTADYHIDMENLQHSIFVSVGPGLPEVWSNQNYQALKVHNNYVYNDQILLSFLAGNFVQYDQPELLETFKVNRYEFAPALSSADAEGLEIYFDPSDGQYILKMSSQKATKLFLFSKKMRLQGQAEARAHDLTYIGPLFHDRSLFCNQSYCAIKKSQFFAKFDQFNSIINIKCEQVKLVSISFVQAYILCFYGKQVDIYPLGKNQIDFTDPYQFPFLGENEQLDKAFVSKHNPNLILLGIKSKPPAGNNYYLLALQLFFNVNGLERAFAFERVNIEYLLAISHEDFTKRLKLIEVIIVPEYIVLLLYNAHDYFILNYKYDGSMRVRFQYVLTSQSFSFAAQKSLNIKYLSTISKCGRYAKDDYALMFRLDAGAKSSLFYFSPNRPYYDSLSSLIPLRNSNLRPIPVYALGTRCPSKLVVFLAQLDQDAVVSVDRIKIRNHPTIDMKEFLSKPTLTFFTYNRKELLEFNTANLFFIKSQEILSQGLTGRMISIPANPQLPMYFTFSRSRVSGNVYNYQLGSSFNLELVTQDIYLKNILVDVQVPLDFAQRLSNFTFSVVDSYIVLYNEKFMHVYNPDGTFLGYFLTNSLFALDTVTLLQVFNLKVNQRCHFLPNSRSYIKVFWNDKFIYVVKFKLQLFSLQLEVAKKRVLSNYYRRLKIEMFDEFILFKTPAYSRLAFIESFVKGDECFYTMDKYLKSFDIHWLTPAERDFLKLENKAFWFGSFRKNSKRFWLELMVVENKCLVKMMVTQIKLSFFSFSKLVTALKIMPAPNNVLKVALLGSYMINPIIEISYESILKNLKRVREKVERAIRINFAVENRDQQAESVERVEEQPVDDKGSQSANDAPLPSAFDFLHSDLLESKERINAARRTNNLVNSNGFEPLRIMLPEQPLNQARIAKHISTNIEEQWIGLDKKFEGLLDLSFEDSPEPGPSPRNLKIKFNEYRKLFTDNVVRTSLSPVFTFMLNPLSHEETEDVLIFGQSNFIFIRQISEQGAVLYGYDLQTERLAFSNDIEEMIGKNPEAQFFYGTYFLFNETQYPFIKTARYFKIISETPDCFKLIALGQEDRFHLLTIQKNVQIIVKNATPQTRRLYLNYTNHIWHFSEAMHVRVTETPQKQSNALKQFLVLSALSIFYTGFLILLHKRLSK